MRARNRPVSHAVAQSFKDAVAIRVADLGSGTGSTVRALAPCFPKCQRWRLFDNDLGLLVRARATPHPAAATVTAIHVDLSQRS